MSSDVILKNVFSFSLSVAQLAVYMQELIHWKNQTLNWLKRYYFILVIYNILFTNKHYFSKYTWIILIYISSV